MTTRPVNTPPKPEPEVLVALNFKVAKAFRWELKLTAALDGKNMTQVLQDALPFTRLGRPKKPQAVSVRGPAVRYFPHALFVVT
jgi:hypothetical protein